MPWAINPGLLSKQTICLAFSKSVQRLFKNCDAIQNVSYAQGDGLNWEGDIVIKKVVF